MHDLVYAASLDGRHLWLGLLHDEATPPPAVRLGTGGTWLGTWPAEPDAPPPAPGRATAAWRIPLPAAGGTGDLVVDFHHGARSVPVRSRLAPGRGATRPTTDGRAQVTVALVDDRLVVRRTPRPAHVPVTGWAFDGAEVVARCAWDEPAEVLLVRDGTPVDRLSTSHADGRLSVRLHARLPVLPGQRARVVADTASGLLPLRRRHDDPARPDRAVVLPLLGDREHGGALLQLRYDRSGALLVARAADDRAAPLCAWPT